MTTTRPTFTVEEQEKEMFQTIIEEQVRAREAPRGHSMSAQLRDMVRAYIEDNSEWLEDNPRYEEEFEPYLRESEYFRTPASSRDSGRERVAIRCD